MNHEDRKDPETLIGRVPESKKGRLKVYLGGAAGVGKTYRMLEEAHQLHEQDMTWCSASSRRTGVPRPQLGSVTSRPSRSARFQIAALS